MTSHFNPLERRSPDGKWTRGPKGQWSKAELDAKHPIDAKNVVSMYDQSNDNEKAEGREWYQSTHDLADALSKKYPQYSLHQISGIIAAYSPQTSLGSNYRYVTKSLREGKAVGPGPGFMVTAGRQKQAQRIMDGEDWRNVLPKGQKTSHFAATIEDPSIEHHAVLDVHAQGVVRGTNIVKEQEQASKPSTLGKYNEMSGAFDDATGIINKRDGENYKPHEIQAITWLAKQRVFKKKNAGRQATRGRNDWAKWVKFAKEAGILVDSAPGGGVGYSNLGLDNLDFAKVRAQLQRGESEVVDLARSFPGPGRVAAAIGDPASSDINVRVAKILASKGDSATAALIPVLKPYGITPNAVRMAMSIAKRGTKPMTKVRLASEGLKTPTTMLESVRDNELYYRAAFIVQSARRIQSKLDGPKPVKAILADESLMYRRHEDAKKSRMSVAAKIQRASNEFGDLLGWYLNPLLNNEEECRAANGHNFYASQGTIIGFPGSVHPNCGCVAGPPIEGAGMVNDAVKSIALRQRQEQTKIYRLKKVV